jgi:hypothetical protein
LCQLTLPGQLEAIMRPYIVIGALAVLAISTCIYAANTHPRTRAGPSCNVDCSSYDAGYRWAKQRGIDNDDYCPAGNKLFYEGCVAYVVEPYRTPYEADNGKGTPTPLNPDDYDDDDNN